MRLKAEIGAYSSVVGQSVHLIHEDGRMAGQVAILCHTNEMRDREVIHGLLVRVAAAINERAQA